MANKMFHIMFAVIVLVGCLLVGVVMVEKMDDTVQVFCDGKEGIQQREAPWFTQNINCTAWNNHEIRGII